MEEDNITASNENSNKMTTLELVTYHFKELGFENENPEDLQMVADLHERWLNKDKRELTEREYVISQDPDVKEVLRRCRLTDSPKRRLTKTDLQVLLEQIAKGEVTRRDYVGKDALPVELTPNFTERINAVKMLMGEADNEGAEKIFFVDDIESKYKELELGDNN